jgi:hypothetical protein
MRYEVTGDLLYKVKEHKPFFLDIYSICIHEDELSVQGYGYECTMLIV